MSVAVRLVVRLSFLVPVIIAPGVAFADGETVATTRECSPPAGENPHEDPSLAPPSEAGAAAHLKRGSAAHRVQDYDEAIAEFKAGAKLSAAPVFLYALAQSFRVSGRFEEAIRSYELFLDRAQPGAVLRGVVECHIGNMRAELERAAMTMPPTDMPSDEPAQVPPLGAPTATPPPRWYDDPAGFAIAGTGLVVAVVGGGLVLNAAGLDEDARNEDREPVRDELRDKADTRRLWGGILAASGTAVLAAGVVKLALVPDARSERSSVTVVVAPGTLGVGVVGRF